MVVMRVEKRKNVCNGGQIFNVNHELACVNVTMIVNILLGQ